MKLLAAPENFISVVRSYDILPGWGVLTVAHALPWIELILGVFIVLGLWLRQSLVTLWLFNTAFIAAIASTLIRKLPLEDCGCFGEALHLSPKQVLLLDGALWVLFALLLIFMSRVRALSLDKYFDK